MVKCKEVAMDYLITVDLDKCTGCQICELACSLYNAKECNPEKSRVRIVRSEIDGIIYTIPTLCQQCETPMCMEMCPIGAISRNTDTGALIVDEDRCIGCRRCVNACPYGAIMVDPDTQVASKCTMCDGEPKCVEFCPKDALEYVRVDKISIKKRRESIDKFLEYQKLLASSSVEGEE